MFGGGKGMGGGAGGGMSRVVGRVVGRAGVTGGNTTTFQEPLSASGSGPASATSASRANASQKLNSSNNNSNNLSISSGSCPFSSLPVNANSGVSNSWPAFVSSPTSASSCCDEFEWVPVDGFVEEEKPVGFLDDFVLGAVPSVDEVQNAVSALQHVFDPSSCSQLVRDKYSYSLGKDMGDCISIPPELMHQVSSAGSELEWMEPSLNLLNSSKLQSHHGFNRVHDAFRLLQTEPSVQRMVVSLSSDKAVWDAVLNNEVVRELRESYSAGEDGVPHGSVVSSDNSNEAVNVVKWIFDNTRAKFMEVFETISRLVNDLFGPPPKNEATTMETTDPFEKKLRTSFLLSVVVLLVVVVTRAHGA